MQPHIDSNNDRFCLITICEMWNIVVISLVFRVSCVFGQNVTDVANEKNVSTVNPTNFDEFSEELKAVEFGSFLDEMEDWASSASEYIRGRSEMTTFQAEDDGRRLKHKKAELKFMMKTLLILKVVLGIILPLGIFASKILSWKAVTLSLMAFMLSKILFIKNLLLGKNAFSVTPTNFLPPFIIHGGPNEAFWKRQGDTHTVYPWTST